MLGHLERVMNLMMSSLAPDPLVIGSQADRPEFSTTGDSIVLVGYSRSQGGMVISRLQYSRAAGGWRFGHVRPLSKLGGRVLGAFGDRRSVSRYRYLLECLLEDRESCDHRGHLTLSRSRF
jgi:hypothetical protein